LACSSFNFWNQLAGREFACPTLPVAPMTFAQRFNNRDAGRMSQTLKDSGIELAQLVRHTD
jgi:hypothetical protein